MASFEEERDERGRRVELDACFRRAGAEPDVERLRVGVEVERLDFLVVVVAMTSRYPWRVQDDTRR